MAGIPVETEARTALMIFCVKGDGQLSCLSKGWVFPLHSLKLSDKKETEEWRATQIHEEHKVGIHYYIQSFAHLWMQTQSSYTSNA